MPHSDRPLRAVSQTTDDLFTCYDYDYCLYENEPLYQIYHQNAVVRDVISQNTSDSEDGQELYTRCFSALLKALLHHIELIRSIIVNNAITPWLQKDALVRSKWRQLVRGSVEDRVE